MTLVQLTLLIMIAYGCGQVLATTTVISTSKGFRYKLSHTNCTYRTGGYGDITQCLSNEVAVQSCGSGKNADCELDGKKVYDYIKCCPFENYSFGSCTTQYGDYGEDLSCIDKGNKTKSSILEGICGSGKNKDCNGAAHMINCCEGRISTGSNPDDYKQLIPVDDECIWTYANHGYPLYCMYTEIMFGRCGSGRDSDCDKGDWYHGIQCCPVISN